MTRIFVLVLSASLAGAAQADSFRVLRVYGPAYGTRANPVPDARIIHINPDAIADGPLYNCARLNCVFQWGNGPSYPERKLKEWPSK